MNKKTIGHCILIILTIFLLLYLAGSFMSATFDITMWTQKQRSLVMMTTVGISYIAVSSYLNFIFSYDRALKVA